MVCLSQSIKQQKQVYNCEGNNVGAVNNEWTDVVKELYYAWPTAELNNCVTILSRVATGLSFIVTS